MTFSRPGPLGSGRTIFQDGFQDRAGVPIWHEVAALVREVPHDGCPRELVREGPLWEILAYVDQLDEDAQLPLAIALPDRRAPPLRFEYCEILALLGRYDRPRYSGRR